MGPMRLRLGALAFVAVLLAVVSGGCKFSGVSTTYMAIDSMGAQRRDVFYTDTTSIYCVTKFSSAKQDATVDFTILEIPGEYSPHPLHNIFSTYEIVPGPSTEAPVVFMIPPNGVNIMISCLGVCIQNGAACPSAYTDEGDDSCGIGATCCFSPVAQTASPPPVLPYPVGNFECVVEIDGAQVGATDFAITYPPAGPAPGNYICPVPPPVEGIICTGWVPEGAKCPGFDSFQICTCKGAAWNCEDK